MTEFRGERFFADYPVPIADVPTGRHAIVSGPVGKRKRPERPEVAAAAPTHTGAMIALIPSAGHVDRLAVDGGEPAEELHLTLMYLGEATDIPEGIRAGLHDVAAAYAASTAPIEGDGFAVEVFNPHNPDVDTALVMGVGGHPLADLHAGVSDRVGKLMTPPEQHSPYVPHVTLKYTDDLGEIPGLVGKLGPVTFDRLRVAMGDEVTDYPLTGTGNDFDVEAWAAGNAGKLRLGQPGGFRRCVKRLRDEPGVTDPEGLCATMHHRATGKWPGEGHIVTAGAGWRSWREELHDRDQAGKFSEKSGSLDVGDSPAMGKFPKIRDLILLESTEEDTPVGAEVRRDVEKAIEGTYVGLEVKVDKVTAKPGSTEFTAGIYDADGEKVGKMRRTLHQGDDGELWVKHDLLEMDEGVQGQGFAEALGDHLEEWYKDSGISNIQLDANIDVGGYAWARKGYDFANETSARAVAREFADAIERAQMELDGIDNQDSRQARDLQRQLTEANRLLEDFANHQFGSMHYPTPFDVSQAGRGPGGGRDATWIGKDALLGSRWDGVKWLN